MQKARTALLRAMALAGTFASTLVMGAGLDAADATHSTVSAVRGSAYGYYARVSLLGGPYSERGPTGTTGCDATSTISCSPSVTLASDAANSPQTASDPDGAIAQYGPAVLFQSGAMDVRTEGAVGDAGSASSLSHVVGYQDSVDTDPDGDGPGPFLWNDLVSSCAATTSGASALTALNLGVLVTSTDANGNPATTEAVPDSPPVNYTRSGTINHVGDSYRAVFNEQVTNADGSLTVNAAHIYLLGPTAKGDVIIGQSVCGVGLASGEHATDLAVQITDSPDPVVPGGDVTYTVTVSNLGLEPASSVTLFNSLTGARLVSATPSDTDDTCTVGKAKSKGIVCELGTIAAGRGETVTIVATAPRRAGSMSLSSAVWSAATETDTRNNAANETTTIGRL